MSAGEISKQGSASLIMRPKSRSFCPQLTQWDMFSAQIPTFNLGGAQKVQTWAGSLASLFIIAVTIAFALLKFEHLVQRRSPAITMYDQDLSTDKEVDSFTAGGPENDFMMAFGISDFFDDIKDDSRYLKWVARKSGTPYGGSYQSQYIPMRKCTAADYAKLYEPKASVLQKLEMFKAQESLYCLELDEKGVDLYSSWVYSQGYQALEIVILPCGAEVAQSEEKIRDDCVWDQQAVIEQLGTFYWNIFYNSGKFQLEKYGDDRISYSTLLGQVAVDPSKSNWVPAFIEKNTLEDETQLLQLGQQSSIEYYQMSFEATRPSSYFTWPTKESPQDEYRLSSIWLELKMDEKIIQRQTYSMLHCIGDVGGLFDGLRMIGNALFAPIAALAMNSELLSSLFSDNSDGGDRKAQEKMASHNYYQKLRRHRKMANKAEAFMTKRLDLVRFFRGQRMLVIAALATLTGQQRERVQHLGKMTASELEKCASSDADSDNAADAQKLTQVFGSTVDKRIDNLAKLLAPVKAKEKLLDDQIPRKERNSQLTQTAFKSRLTPEEIYSAEKPAKTEMMQTNTSYARSNIVLQSMDTDILRQNQKQKKRLITNAARVNQNQAPQKSEAKSLQEQRISAIMRDASSLISDDIDDDH